MKRINKIMVILLAVTMISTLFTACGFTEKTIVTINNEKVSEPLYRIYLWSVQQELESLAPNIWDMELEGKKTEDIAKERALDSVKVSLAAKQKAKELGIELSKEDKAKIKDNAKQFMEKNSDVVKQLNIKQSHIEEFFTYGSLIEKVIDKISGSYVPNDEELKTEIESSKASYETVTVKHVLITNKDETGQNLPEDKAKEAKALAEDILNKALAGEDMAALAKQYSEDPGSKDSGGEYTFKRGEMVPEFEDAAFSGEVGKVYPKLVETDYGYHIIKVEKHTMGDEAQIKKDSEQRVKQKFAEDELTELSNSMKVEKTELYNQTHILRKDSPNTATPATTPAVASPAGAETTVPAAESNK